MMVKYLRESEDQAVPRNYFQIVLNINVVPQVCLKVLKRNWITVLGDMMATCSFYFFC